MTDHPQPDWQQAFITTNLLVLGYNAWCGFLTGARGAVVCSLNSPQLGMTGESFPAHYISRARLAPFLNAWLAIPDTVILTHHHITSHILDVVDGYNPETDIILLLESGDLASFFYLRNLPISPPQSYEVVCKGWDEFKPIEPDYPKTQLFQNNLKS
ncbi:hypothetical protein [Acaryochloris marina]|uniref:Uncharacterized protein n=1 Tax=Acaryochloris marina (strain MBIC 11017) TaxID=329726 RepID=A8ZQ32_ACAM1|nr:hypothetical protein [Acaryochloris marina]ABW33133.1 conserved hypothetical protein [Acaryochloris marina MBIC11017]